MGSSHQNEQCGGCMDLSIPWGEGYVRDNFFNSTSLHERVWAYIYSKSSLEKPKEKSKVTN